MPVNVIHYLVHIVVCLSSQHGERPHSIYPKLTDSLLQMWVAPGPIRTIPVRAVRRTVNDYRPAMGVMAAVVSAMVSALIDLLDL